MRCIAVLLIGGKDTGVLQSLLQVPALACGLGQQYQCIARDAALVGLDFIGTVGLRAAVRRLRELISLTGRASKLRVPAGIRRERLRHQVVAHRSRRL